jgi:hypothetical protein
VCNGFSVKKLNPESALEIVPRSAKYNHESCGALRWPPDLAAYYFETLLFYLILIISNNNNFLLLTASRSGDLEELVAFMEHFE